MIVTGIYRYVTSTADMSHKEPYVELLVWNKGGEHMVTIEYDDVGSYFILDDKKYYIKNTGTYFSPVFEIEEERGNI